MRLIIFNLPLECLSNLSISIFNITDTSLVTSYNVYQMVLLKLARQTIYGLSGAREIREGKMAANSSAIREQYGWFSGGDSEKVGDWLLIHKNG